MTRLEYLRVNAGLSPEQLGELAGVSGMTVRRIESGHSAQLSTLKKLADYFGVGVLDLRVVLSEHEEPARSG